MSVRIFEDIEEAISREVRRITTHDNKTIDKVVLRETYDPFDGSVIVAPIEANFYDSSADASKVEYPHFFVKILKTREDRFSGREIPLYGKWCEITVKTSPRAFEIITNGGDGTINAVGNVLNTGILGISKILPGNLLRLLNGNNAGTYLVDTITKDALGNHAIAVSNTIATSLPAFQFDATTRELVFTDGVDINTVKVGDVFTDNSAATFNITAVAPSEGKFTIDGLTTPDTTAESSVARPGDVFTQTDLSLVRFLIMDADKPVQALSATGLQDKNSQVIKTNPPVPIDTFYRIRIDSKTRENHRDILNRIWEEFNPPRTALPVIRRTELSADALLQEDILAGGSDTLTFLEKDVQEMNIGDKVFLCDELTPSKREDGCGFELPFESVIVAKPSSTTVQLADAVPDTFTVKNCTKLITNAEYENYMFHFQDHVTKDNEGAQYWVHEFTFWVQHWIDRQGTGEQVGTVTDIGYTIEDNDGDGDDSNNFVYVDEC